MERPVLGKSLLCVALCFILLSILPALSTGLGTTGSDVAGDYAAIAGPNFLGRNMVQGAGPDFSVTANPEVVVVDSGAAVSANVTVTSLGGFAGTVYLSKYVFLANVYASVSPNNIVLGSGESANFNVTLHVRSDSPSGNYTTSFVATSGYLSHTIGITVSVTSTPSFDLSLRGFCCADPFPTVSVRPGESKEVVVTAHSINSFSGELSLSVDLLQGSTDATFSMAPSSLTLTAGGSANSTLTVAAPENAEFNGGVLQVNATSGPISSWVRIYFSIREHLSLTYDDVLTISPGSTATTRVQLSTNGFTAYVNVTASTPSGITASLGPETVTVNGTARLENFTLNVEVAPGVTPGTYNMTVTAVSYIIKTVTNATTGAVISMTPKEIGRQALTVPVTVSQEVGEPTILGLPPVMFYAATAGSLAILATFGTVFIWKRKMG